MTVTPIHRAGDPPPADDLEAFIRDVDERLGEPTDDAYAITYGLPGPGGPDVLEYLPIGYLLGWQAPPEVDRIVVVAGGRASAAEDYGQPARIPGCSEIFPLGQRSVSVVVAGDRSGRLAGRLRIEGSVQEQAPTGGRLVDTLRRCFGLPTGEPASDPARFLACLWLGAISAATRPRRRHRGRLTWSEALRLHPANALLIEEDPDLPDYCFEEIARRAPAAWSWEQLRLATMTNGSLDELCPLELASWMDAGMFARWILGSIVPLEQLVPAAAERLDGSAVRQLAALLDQQGIDIGLVDAGAEPDED